MPNLRISSDNAADTAVIVASASAGGMLPAALQTPTKSDVWRCPSTAGTLTLTWPGGVWLACVAAAFSNLSSGALMRARVYANISDGGPVIDTGAQLACPPLPLEQTNFGRDSLADYAYASTESVGSLWFAPVFGKTLVLDIVDASGIGYIDIGRLWVGDYWEPESNFDRGGVVGIADSSKNFRTDAGDLQTSVGARYRTLTLALSLMARRDRDKVWKIIQKNGASMPMLISCYPESTADPMYEQMCTMICKLTSKANISSPFFSRFSVPLEFEEV